MFATTNYLIISAPEISDEMLAGILNMEDGKVIGIARERKIPFSYLHGVNMEQIIRQIYESGK